MELIADFDKSECFPTSELPGGDVFGLPSPSKALDFCSCRNRVVPPRNLTRLIKKARLDMLPDPLYKKANENLAERHSLKGENIVIENTVFSIFNLLIKSLRLRNAAIVTPCETYYKNICRHNYCDQKPFVMTERSNFTLNCDGLIEWLTSRFDALIISNPNTITGRVVEKQDMLAILDYCQSKGIYVIVDESYMDFVLQSQSVAGCVNEYRNTVVINSPAEYHGVPGLNAVYAAASSEVAEILRENRLPCQIDAQASVLLENAYRSEKFAVKTKKWIFEEKNSFVKNLQQLKSIKILHSDCHYILIKLDEVSSTTVFNRLKRSNILIRDASSVTGLDGSYIRVSVCGKKENTVFTDELMRCLI